MILRIMDQTGDTTLEVGINDITDTEVEGRFNELISEGMMAFAKYDDGRGEAVVRKYDATAEQITMRRPMVGG